MDNFEIPSASWLAGFTDAEGCYMVKIPASKTHSLGFKVYLEFNLTQHQRDEQLIKKFIDYFSCGRVENFKNDVVNFKVTKFEDIVNKIIPFFKKHSIKGVKSEDFKDFCLVADMMKEKKHLTTEGLNQIKLIKAGMNKGRKFS